MKLPNAHLALVEREKVTEYLLNPAHPDNGGKAPFFTALGFRRDDWEKFAAALRQMALRVRDSSCVVTEYGEKYIIDGAIETPSGKSPVVRTVWIVDKGAEAARLVTAYPHDE